MGNTIGRRVLAAAVLAMTFGTARAEVVINITEVGPNVVATASGSIDLTGLTFGGTDEGSFGSEMGPNYGYVVVGTASRIDEWLGVTGPSSFGNGGYTPATSGSGGFIGIVGLDGDLGLQHNYISGTTITSTSEYDNTTLSGLGLILGTYTYTWGTGGPDHTLTVLVGVPEPSTAIVAVFGAVAFTAYGWSRHRRAQRRQPAA